MLTFKYYLSILIALVAMVLIVSCSDEDEENASEAWTSLQKTAYISQCAKALPEEQCNCQFDAISEEWNYDEFQDLNALDLAKVTQIGLDCAL